MDSAQRKETREDRPPTAQSPQPPEEPSRLGPPASGGLTPPSESRPSLPLRFRDLPFPQDGLDAHGARFRLVRPSRWCYADRESRWWLRDRGSRPDRPTRPPPGFAPPPARSTSAGSQLSLSAEPFWPESSGDPAFSTPTGSQRPWAANLSPPKCDEDPAQPGSAPPFPANHPRAQPNRNGDDGGAVGSTPETQWNRSITPGGPFAEQGGPAATGWHFAATGRRHAAARWVNPYTTGHEPAAQRNPTRFGSVQYGSRRGFQRGFRRGFPGPSPSPTWQSGWPSSSPT